MRRLPVSLVATLLAVSLYAGGCGSRSTSNVEHYVSPQIEGASARINLEEVQKAFWETQGKDFNTWMAAFEKRVNEVYDGKDVVSIDATKKDGHLVVTGYINSQKKEGYQPGDEKLFAIEQTGDALNNEMPYRVTQQDGGVYYQGHHSILDNPILQMMLISHMMGGWGGRYYTPYDRVVVLDRYRDSYRATPQYTAQQASNSGFFSRFKQKNGGGLQSTNSFGSTNFSANSANKRSWGGGTSASSPTGATSGWGGRRPTSFAGSGLGGFRSSRGWGGRRR